MTPRQIVQKVSAQIPRVVEGLEQGAQRAERGLRAGQRVVRFLTVVSNGLRRLQEGDLEEVPPPPTLPPGRRR